MAGAPAIAASPLDGDRTRDVVVIGAGVADLSTAYELSRFGRAVIVIDRGATGRGMTARTTAYLATELDDFYSELIRTRGEDEARLYYDSQVAAVNRIEAICQYEGIDADFARVDGCWRGFRARRIGTPVRRSHRHRGAVLGLMSLLESFARCPVEAQAAVIGAVAWFLPEMVSAAIRLPKPPCRGGARASYFCRSTFCFSSPWARCHMRLNGYYTKPLEAILPE